jgi:hypothetical protein
MISGFFGVGTKSLFELINLSNIVTILNTDFQSMIHGMIHGLIHGLFDGKGLAEGKDFREGKRGRGSEGFLPP